MDGEEFPVTLGKQVEKTRQALHALGTAYYHISRLNLKTKKIELVKRSRKGDLNIKDKGLVGQHGEKTVSVLCSRKLHERRGKLYHEMGLVWAVRRVVPLHFPHNAPRFRFNQPVPQCGDMRLEISRRKLLPAAPFFL